MDTGWYVAELIMEITISGAARNVIHRNLILVRAGSPAEAYEKSVRLGQEGETSYENPAGNFVQHWFKGVSKLDSVVWDLEDGSELMFEEYVGIPADEIGRWIPPKERLAAFRPQRPRPTDETDYSSDEVLKMVARRAEEGE